MIPLHTARPLVTLSALALLAMPAFGQKQPDVRANASPAGMAFASQPKIAAQGDNVYVVWSDSRNGGQDIYFTSSADRGATWLAADIRLNTDPAGSALSLEPQISVQGTTIYVAWVDYRNGGSLEADIYFNRSSDGGANWLSQDVRLNTDPVGPTGGASRAPVLSSAGTNVYAAWLDNRNEPNNDVYANYSNDSGVTWQASDVRVDTNMGPLGVANNPAICATGSKVYVGWNELRSGTQLFDVYLNYSLDAGATWQAQDLRIDSAPGNTTSQFVSMDCEGDRIYVTWWDNRNTYVPTGAQDDDIYLNYSSDSGSTWQAADIRLDVNTGTNPNPPGATKSNWPQVRVQGMDVYVVWEDWRNGTVAATTQADVFFNHSPDGGATWLTDDIQVSHALDDGVDHSPALPQMCVQGSGIYVTWVDIRNGESDVYFNRSTDKGVTWLSSDVRMDTDAAGSGASNEARIACSGKGVFVVWSDDRIARAQMTAGTDVFVNVPFGGYEYGTGTAGSGGLTPAISSGGQPTLGDQFTVDVTNGLGGSPGALVIGVQKTAIPLFGGTILALPFMAPGIFLGGTLGVPGTGTFSLPLGVPNNEAFVGVPLYFQALILDPAAPESLSMTNGVEVWIG